MRWWTGLVLLVSLGIAPSVTGRLSAAELNIAVLDLERVFNESKMTQAQTEALQDSFRGREQELSALQQEIRGLKKDQQLYLPENPEFRRLALEIELTEYKLKLLAQGMEREAALAQTKATAEAYEMINQMAGRFAEQEGIDMVLVKPKDEVSSNDPGRLQLQMHAQTLFWAAPKFDVTDKFLAWLDTAAAPATPAATPSTPVIDLDEAAAP